MKPIIEIERPDRDDVFRKSNKPDRPNYGSNMPFELFSALANMHLNQTRQSESNEEAHEDNQGTTDATDNTEAHETDNANQETAEQTETEGNSETKHEEHAPPAVPNEFAVRLQHKKSLDEQVIETKQDNDLSDEMKKNKEEGEHQPGEDLARVEDDKSKESV